MSKGRKVLRVRPHSWGGAERHPDVVLPHVFLGINIDTGAIADPGILMDCMRSGFAEILAVAGQADR